VKKNFIQELTWRGMMHDCMPGTEELLNNNSVKGYIGFDPSSDSLGVGNLVQIMTLLHFQQCGHQPIALVGGATGLVGDPSGKSVERNLLSVELIQYNLECQKNQLERFLDFGKGSNAASIVNNYDWFKDFNFLEFIRQVGKHISINYMLAKDSVKNRLENGMSFTEFCYQLIQGYDFYYLWKNHGVMLQMGGSDQWGNIVTGTELIRRMDGGEAFALTTPLIKKADGTKFGKSESGNVWLDPSKTSPYHFLQFLLNASDTDAANYIRIFTTLGKDEIEAFEEDHAKAPHLRILQNAVAKDITTRVHSAQDYKSAMDASEILFGKGTSESLAALSESDLLNIFDGVPRFEFSKSLLESKTVMLDLLAVETNVFESKGEAKKMIMQGAVAINKNKISDLAMLADTSMLIAGKYLLIQKGKKNYYLLTAV